MKFKIGDRVIVKKQVIKTTMVMEMKMIAIREITGTVQQINNHYRYSFPYQIKFDNGQVWCFLPDDIELAQSYLNEQKMKKLLGVE